MGWKGNDICIPPYVIGILLLYHKDTLEDHLYDITRVCLCHTEESSVPVQDSIGIYTDEIVCRPYETTTVAMSYGWVRKPSVWDSDSLLCYMNELVSRSHEIPTLRICHVDHDDVIKWKHFPRCWICAGNSPVTGEFPAQRPVTRSFDVFFDLHLNKRLNKQWWGWWFETPSRPLWRYCKAHEIPTSRICHDKSSVFMRWDY